MRIRDDTAAAKALTLRWVVLGASYVAAARNAVVAYEKWYGTIVPETDDPCPYPIDETLATYFLVSATAEARSNHAARHQAALEKGGASPEWRAREVAAGAHAEAENVSASMRQEKLIAELVEIGAPGMRRALPKKTPSNKFSFFHSWHIHMT